MFKIIDDVNLPQLLLIHGGGVGSWMWDDVIAHLREHFQIILVTIPYHDETVSSSSPFTIQSFASSLLEELPNIRNEHPISVVGFSLGAQISLELLALAPSYFSFAMINSALCTKMNIPFSLIKLLSACTIPLAKLKFFSRLQAKIIYIPHYLFDAYYKLSCTITATQLAEILHTNMSFEVKPSIKQSTTPIYITYGEKENRAIKKSASVLQDFLPHSITYVIKGIGHGFPLADAKHFSQFILNHYK